MYNYQAYLKLPKPKPERRANPALQALGYRETDRVVILHADDIGMCHASVAGYLELHAAGIISTATMMVPCPWYPYAVARCRELVEIDMGVHLTVNSEWPGLRWGPISTRSPNSGLLDQAGYFPRTREPVVAQVDLDALRTELAAQVERALADGIDVTHIDEHLGTVAHPRLLPVYVEIARAYRVVPMLVRHSEADYCAMGFTPAQAASAAQLLRDAEASGMPLIDHYGFMPLGEHDARVDAVQRFLDDVPAGLTHLAIHPAADTPELRALARDWRARVADLAAFTSDALRRYLQTAGVHVIGYRALREVMRARLR